MFSNSKTTCGLALFFLLGPHGNAAEDGNLEKLRLLSADGVELRVTFHPGTEKSATVLLLHDLGKSSAGRTWRELAQTLHKEGWAVLQFDFRGHGRSNTVDPDAFWSNRFANRALVRANDDTSLIGFDDFDSRYYPMLVNDIASARAFLDRQNDLRRCNSSNLIVIGAGSGATLGSLWLQAECHRFRVTPGALLTGPRLEARPEAADVLCGIWLSARAKLGERTVDLPALTELPGREHKVPLVFMHAEGDEVGKKSALACARRLLRDKAKLPYTGATEVPVAEAVGGEQLLSRHAELSTAIVKYIHQVLAEGAQEWTDGDHRNAEYAWRLPGAGSVLPANQPGEKNLTYFDYGRFLSVR